MKYFLILVSIFGWWVLFTTIDVSAGGCCYKSFSATQGIAGKQSAQITASFIEPKAPYTQVLTQERVTVHIDSPKVGQSCATTADRTDDEGEIQAICSSDTSGIMKIYFSAPDLDAESNINIGFVRQQIFFDENPELTSIPEDPIDMESQISPTRSETMTDEGIETKVLQEKVQQLEQKLESQEQEVSALKSLIQRMVDFFNNFFR